MVQVDAGKLVAASELGMRRLVTRSDESIACRDPGTTLPDRGRLDAIDAATPGVELGQAGLAAGAG